MRGSFSRRASIVTAAVLIAAFAAVTGAEASNMAFKLNLQVFPLLGGARGKNLVSLPDRNPYQGSGGLSRLCTALGLSANGQVTFWNGTGGVFVYTCGQVETFTLQDDKGVMITDTAAHTGIIVGSQVPGKTYFIKRLGQSPIGTNIFPVAYNTTAVNPQDICSMCGLSNTATLSQFDADIGQILTHTCGSLPVWNLRLGAALLILENTQDVSCVQSHF
jgi:hypothetical protein